MKKIIALLVTLILIAAAFAGCRETEGQAGTGTTGGPETTATPVDPNMKVALITDYAGVDDRAYNQEVFEAAQAWCGENGVGFTWYQPAGDSTEERVTKIRQAVKEGYTVLLLPGYSFADAIAETVENYPDVKYVAMDVSEYDLQSAKGYFDDPGWEYPANLYACVYREEIGGYLAGYAAVKLGYRKLGFLDFTVPQTMRCGCGFLQGADAAAKDLGIQDEVELKYVYHNCFCTEYIEPWAAAWFEQGTELIFSTRYYLRLMAPPAREFGGRFAAADLSSASLEDGDEELIVTSARKGYGLTVRTQLERIARGGFEGGKVETLGIVSENPEENFVQLSADTCWNEGFTEADYRALVAELYSGSRTVSDEIEHLPEAEITVVDYGFMGHRLP